VSQAFYDWCLKVLDLGSRFPGEEPTAADWVRRYPIQSKDGSEFCITPRLAYKLYKTAEDMKTKMWEPDPLALDYEVSAGLCSEWYAPASCRQFEHNDAWLRTMQAHVQIAALRLRMGNEFKQDDAWGSAGHETWSSAGHEVAMHCVIRGFYEWYHETMSENIEECYDGYEVYDQLPSYPGLDPDDHDDDEMQESVYEFLIPESDVLLLDWGPGPRDWFSLSCSMDEFIAFQKEVSFALVDGYLNTKKYGY